MKTLTNEDSIKALQTGRDAKFSYLYRSILAKGWKDSPQFKELCHSLYIQGYSIGMDHATFLYDQIIEKFWDKLGR